MPYSEVRSVEYGVRSEGAQTFCPGTKDQRPKTKDLQVAPNGPWSLVLGPWSNRGRGLTLIELLIAIAILVTVTASTLLIFRGVTKAWQSGQVKTERYQQARLLFDLFARELTSCLAHSRYPFVGQDALDEDHLRPDTIQDELFFVGTLPGRSGLVERGYWVNRAGEMMCHDDEPADGDYVSTGVEEPCGRDVVEFDVSYFDGTQWLPQWDGRAGGAQAGKVPKAIHIILAIGEHATERFETVISIPTG